MLFYYFPLEPFLQGMGKQNATKKQSDAEMGQFESFTEECQVYRNKL